MNPVIYHIRRFRCILIILLVLPAAAATADDVIKPGEPIDYKRLAFYPDRWEDRGVSTELVPWEGGEVVFLTTTADLDHAVIGRMLEKLDAGWLHFESIVGKRPRPFKQLNNKPTIAAVPDSRLTCGAGCGYIGATGIEVALFYNRDYAILQEQPNAFLHYYFYEMGRNYFVFGDRHSVFKTGFAVLMRYICMDAVEAKDPEANLRKQIEQAEAFYAKSDLTFLDAFTTHGQLSEKRNRLKGFRGPSDQNVMYTSVMLKLRSAYGGDDFLKAFYKHIFTCPKIRPRDAGSALQQTANWLVSASLAAGQDLTPLFVDRWRMPLAAASREALAQVDWAKETRSAGEVIESLRLVFEIYKRAD
ncbi:MAG: calcium-binding protein [Planctomycetota bacterium]